MEKLFEDYGIKVFKAEDKYYLHTYTGELVDSVRIIEVSEDEAFQVMKSEREAYLVLMKYFSGNKGCI